MKRLDYLPPEAETFGIELKSFLMNTSPIEPKRSGYGTGDDFTAPGEEFFVED